MRCAGMSRDECDVIGIFHFFCPRPCVQHFSNRTTRHSLPCNDFENTTTWIYHRSEVCVFGTMKGFNFAMVSAVARTIPRAVSTRGVWTCRQCLLQSRGSRIGEQVRGYARRSNRHGGGNFKSAKPKRNGRVIVAAAGGALGVTGVAFTDDIRHAYEAVERTGRVVSTLAVCINE